MLKWSSLEDWGSGNVRVALDYVARRGDGATAGGYSTSQSFSAAESMTGATLSWTVGSLGDPWWAMDGLSSVSRIRVYKVVDGVEVLMADSTGDAYTPRLELSNLPAAASIVTLEYRKAGSTDPFLLKSTTQIGTGWFSASYDDVPVGAYEYRLTVRDAANNPLDLTSVGGNAQGQISGSIEIRRGGQDLPDSPGNVVTVAKTIASYNAFGEVTA